ncbi:MAG: ABC-type nitrate/sulfonate/bicarbonate transport system substrate-binding protein [Patiriisocius sp.]|jgi:ABC-type nitrate/sulfonate/bicarbonate transport system substrate-binding protein
MQQCIISNFKLKMRTLKIALDWIPNISHIGILVAKQLGYYQEQGIEILNPLVDNYQITPRKKLELGLVAFAIPPFETVISCQKKVLTHISIKKQLM